ncbi:MAG TPA: hypothetical protein VJ953_03375 [Saprospiraceae bacterium]|nr:hypothetical protein [Saprospiraceae bacterium]
MKMSLKWVLTCSCVLIFLNPVLAIIDPPGMKKSKQKDHQQENQAIENRTDNQNQLRFSVLISTDEGQTIQELKDWKKYKAERNDVAFNKIDVGLEETKESLDKLTKQINETKRKLEDKGLKLKDPPSDEQMYAMEILDIHITENKRALNNDEKEAINRYLKLNLLDELSSDYDPVEGSANPLNDDREINQTFSSMLQYYPVIRPYLNKWMQEKEKLDEANTQLQNPTDLTSSERERLEKEKSTAELESEHCQKYLKEVIGLDLNRPPNQEEMSEINKLTMNYFDPNPGPGIHYPATLASYIRDAANEPLDPYFHDREQDKRGREK